MSFCSFFGGEVYKDHFKPGIYVCSKCDNQLFSSRSKYDHSSPWPAFTETIHENSVSKHKESRPGAYKVLCGKCGNGLGHEFVNDGPAKGVSRFWIFSSSLKFVPKGLYVCSECGHELFSSSSKFEHSSLWSSFSETVHEDSVSKHPKAWGPIKVCCGKCGNGLGHEFLDDVPRKGQSRF